MNKLCCLIVVFFTCRVCEGQILCIYCYDQNDTVSAGVNNLLLNGGFESGCLVNGYFCRNSTGYSCNITNWSCTGGGINTYAKMFDIASSTIVEGSQVA